MNEDNSDEFFRKAAEDYRLRTDNPDWETLINKMNTGFSPPADETAAKKKKRHYHFPFLFFHWPHKKISHSSFLRMFRPSSWLEKIKKKN